MGTIKRKKRKKKEQDSNLPMPIHDNSPKIVNGEDPQNTATVEEKKSQHYVQTVLIPEETLFVEESRFAKPSFIIQTSLAVLGLFTLIGFIYFNSLQHNDSVDALKLAKQNSDFADSATKKSLDIAEHAVGVSENASTIQEKYAKVETRCYLCSAGVVEHSFNTNEQWKVTTRFVNTGKTPAYNVRSMSWFNLDTVHAEDMIKSQIPQRQGFIVGAGQDYLVEATTPLKTLVGDSACVFSGKNVLFVYGKLLYEDTFGEQHFTHYCVFFRPSKKDFLNYEKFNDADQYKKTKENH